MSRRRPRRAARASAAAGGLGAGGIHFRRACQIPLGSPQSLLCGACGGPAPEAVKVQIENLKAFLKEREQA